MRNFSCLIGALTLTAGLAVGCTVDVGDPTDSFTDSVGDTNTTVDTNGDNETSDTGMDDVGDTTGDTTGDGDTTSTTGCTPGTFGCECDAGACDEGFECDANNECSLPSGTTSTDTGTTTGELGMCADDDPWCPVSMACDTGMFLSAMGLDAYAWCFHTCDAGMMDTSTCPDPVAGTQVQCVPVGEEGGCVMLCELGSDVCPEGSDCIDIGGAGACLYDNPNN
jgi:hypothetical protein